MPKLVPGYNNDIRLGDVIYHVQTEHVTGRVITLVFRDGAVIARGTQEIGGRVPTDARELIQDLMRKQHKVIIEKLKKGELVPLPKDELAKMEREEADLIAKFLSEWAEEE